MLMLGSAFGTALLAQNIKTTNVDVDCGQVIFKKPVTVEFELVNNSRNDMFIRDVRTSCGCTSVEYPEKRIERGATFFVKATYDAKQLGHFAKQVGIYTANNPVPTYLTMRGVVVSEIKEFEGAYAFKVGDLTVDRADIEFDDVNQGDMQVQEIHVFNNSSRSAEPVVMHLPPYLKAEVSPSTIASGHAGVIRLMLDSQKLRSLGLTQTKIYLGHQPGDKVSRDKEMLVSVVSLPNFQDMEEIDLMNAARIKYEPLALDLGRFNGKNKLKGEVVITNKGLSALKITSLQMYTEGIKVSLGQRSLEVGASTKLKITVDRRQLQHVKGKPRVLLTTNDPKRPKVIIDINVTE